MVSAARVRQEFNVLERQSRSILRSGSSSSGFQGFRIYSKAVLADHPALYNNAAYHARTQAIAVATQEIERDRYDHHKRLNSAVLGAHIAERFYLNAYAESANMLSDR